MGTEQVLENVNASSDFITSVGSNNAPTSIGTASDDHEGNVMTIDEFWAIIEKSNGDSDQTNNHNGDLETLLDELTPEQMEDFNNHWLGTHGKAYRWDLWAVFTIIDNGSSDSSFDHFRYWLIGQGRKVFESVMAKPESLIKYVKRHTNLSGEDLAHVVYRKWLDVTENDDRDDSCEDGAVRWEDIEPAGTRWTAKDLPLMYPALCKRMGVTEHTFT